MRTIKSYVKRKGRITDGQNLAIKNLWSKYGVDFKKEILEPIKYHVLAKRYLANDKKYFDLLSEASKTSLKLQGGALNSKECNKFEAQKYFKPSILLRKFDEAAKRIDLQMKSIHDYKKLLTSKLI